jgi:peptide-methionine (R)-S-oxide reductase
MMTSTNNSLKKNLTILVMCFIAFTQTECTGNNNPIQSATMSDTLQNPNNPYYSRTDTTHLDVPNSEWKKYLSDDVYAVGREAETERAFTGKFWNFEGIGTYYCAVCGNTLFKSDSKFASGCGWPSFFETLRENSVIYKRDNSYGMIRTEVNCGRCDSHLGHVFDDGPPPTGLRYCMNSIVLDFEPMK